MPLVRLTIKASASGDCLDKRLSRGTDQDGKAEVAQFFEVSEDFKVLSPGLAETTARVKDQMGSGQTRRQRFVERPSKSSIGAIAEYPLRKASSASSKTGRAGASG